MAKNAPSSKKMLVNKEELKDVSLRLTILGHRPLTAKGPVSTMGHKLCLRFFQYTHLVCSDPSSLMLSIHDKYTMFWVHIRALPCDLKCTVLHA